jgi:DNA polymerase-3 subunit delta'
MISSNGPPGALLAIVNSESAPMFRDMYARVVLCDSSSGEDECPSCNAWMKDGHPDMVVVGDGTSTPGVADCIELQALMSLRPFIARGRLGVVPASDALSLPAANSLLKLTEEPPEGGHILFLAEENNLIQTIRSRAWTVCFRGNANAEEAPPPASPVEWASWIDRTKKESLNDLAVEADSWSRWLGRAGDWRTSASLRNALYISQKRHMPVSMVQDALIAILREGESIGQIFGDIR